MEETMRPIRGIGLCSTYCQQGDWALDYALSLARRNEAELHIYHILDSPYIFQRDTVYTDSEQTDTTKVTPELLAAKDRELRARYHERLGSYPSVGFRLCEGNHEWELKKGFRKGEYNVLVMGYEENGAGIGGTTTVEKLARNFHAPVVLVGPDHPHSFHLNEKAQEVLYQLNIPKDRYQVLGQETRHVVPLPVTRVARTSVEHRASFGGEIGFGILPPALFPARLRVG